MDSQHPVPRAHPAPTPVTAASKSLDLPLSVVSRVDVGRLLREVEELDGLLDQAAIRSPGVGMKLPKTSRLLDEFLTMNHLSALQGDDRKRLIMFLHTIKAKAPLLHMSFAADPSPRFLQGLMTWLRLNIHPLVLVQVGLQPNIGVGCVLRTTNKFFDLSLRQYFDREHELLLSKLHGAQAAAPAAQAPAPAPIPPPASVPAPTPPAPAAQGSA